MKAELLKLQKKELRGQIRKKLKRMDPVYFSRASASIQEQFLNSDVYLRAESLFLYIHMPQEPATDRILYQALADGKKIYVPKCYENHRMEAIRIRGMADLAPGMMDIPEPVRDEEKAVPGDFSLVVVPCMAASGDGRRLGHGAGFYDIFFDRFHADSLQKICLCFGELLQEDIPVGEQDVRMDRVISEDFRMEMPQE